MPSDKPDEILERYQAETNSSYGTPPDKRTVEQLLEFGIINLNKPKGPTSHNVVDTVRKILQAKKAGHSGTLDPAVTGVLPTALGRATRALQALLSAGKEYTGIMRLHKDVPEEKLKQTLNKFVGKITQLPPVKSAVARKEREREIYYLKVLEINKREVLFQVGCQAGTYIRKLVHDIGKELETGAHMTQLHRTKAGGFQTENTVTLQDLEDGIWYWKNVGNEKLLRHCIKPAEEIVAELEKVWIADEAVDNICHGAPVFLPGIVKLTNGIEQEDLVAIMSLKNELVGLGKAQLTSKEMMEKEKGMAVKTDVVLMKEGTYKRV